VKVFGRKNLPKKGRVIFAANHQLPCDFAMVRRGAGRHFRMLTASDQLGGFFGLLSASGGVISVAFKQKNDGVAAQEGCVRALSCKGFRISWPMAVGIWLGLFAYLAASIYSGDVSGPLVLGLVAVALFVAGCPGSSPALGIFPQGSLLPDDPELKEHFRPGVIKIARETALASGEPVMIVPMAIRYKRNPAEADWTHKHLKGMRSMFLGARNPRAWNPIFKLNLDELSVSERERVEKERKEIMSAYKQAKVTNYGGVVVVGKAINAADLPEDPIKAVTMIKGEIAGLLFDADKH
jgi:1-acyl-sn-glycerol-3-phosphate acyltransferase